MKTAAAILALSGLAAAAAIDFSKFPACSVPCLQEAIPLSGCTDPNDVACFCKPETVQKMTANALKCLLDKCDASKIVEVKNASDEICASVGKSVDMPSGTPTPPPTGVAAPSSASAPADGSTSAVAATTSGAAQPTGTGALTPTASQPAITAGANAGPMVGAIAAVVAVAVAL
ncbi:hypothetical protein JDV02_009827 [Purpureocillium takamizusanense]|uniref:CFEM domain-containing protein n=1 Tax=Purpureocillium takamizusanense TaxID=2060973 RepID=A0A9Q8VFX4_9HYPO|nr:uncharacterized protein JDV02_009827 [Purpureocillium takamizusanense]UNI24048.1 hypothetical protein JDV02_009827 [Purpureocillium takamizusanense]